ncbi:carph-isopro domain-containing protein [Sphingomonas paeninsulae]|uniref:carph-isopro domain-containing protein n=1 Tax=Sphingomonas paeninsulae TaxID=2319844 RepID=UPI003D32C807
MSNFRDLIASRGGIRPLARALGHKNPSTVQGWWERNSIPEAHLPSVSDISCATEQARAA